MSGGGWPVAKELADGGQDLLDRGVVFADLDRSSRASERGVPRLVGLTGPPGAGKSAVLGGVLQRARHSHLLAVRGDCRAGHVGAEAVHEAVLELAGDPWVAQLTAIADVADHLRRVDRTGRGSADRVGDRFSGDLVDAVLGVAAQRMVLIVLDDLHWLGTSGWSLLERLVRAAAYRADRGELVHLQLLVAFRDGVCEDRWEQVVAQAPTVELASTIVLEPLSELAVNRLVRSQLAGRVAGEVVTAVMRRSGGNPLYVHQLCNRLREWQQRTHGSSLRASVAEFDLPGVADLRTLAQDELAAGSHTTLLFVAAAALSVAPLSAEGLQSVVESVVGPATEAWHEALATGLVRFHPAIQSLRHRRLLSASGVMG